MVNNDNGIDLRFASLRKNMEAVHQKDGDRKRQERFMKKVEDEIERVERRSMTEHVFCGSDLTGSDFSGIMALVIPPNLVLSAAISWSGLDLTNTNLSYVNFRGADLRMEERGE